MSGNSLQTMAHHELVNHVQIIITGTASNTCNRQVAAPSVGDTLYPKHRTAAALVTQTKDSASSSDSSIPGVNCTGHMHTTT
jgi:hypothetical protein